MARGLGEFEQVNAELTRDAHQAHGQLSDLQTAWVGSGGRAFESVKDAVRAGPQAAQQGAAETAEAIKTSGVSYDSTDTSAASLITKSGGGGLNLPL
jgi:uncharacterized protein YukE